MALATALVLAGLVALPVIALTSSSGPGRQHSALVFTGPATTEPAPTTTEAPSTTVPATTTTTVAPVQQAAPQTTTTLVCRNSYDQACGAFRWDPSPAPAGTPTVTIKYSSNPVAGQEVTFTVTISDPSTAVYTCGQVSYGDGMNENCTASTASPNCRVRYGPWSPPARYADSVSTSFTYTYKNPGPYTVSAKYPVGNSCYDPYQGWAAGSVPINVAPAPVTTTSTTSTTTAP